MIVTEYIYPWSRDGFEAMLTRVRVAFDEAGYDPATMKLLPMADTPVDDPCQLAHRWQAEAREISGQAVH